MYDDFFGAGERRAGQGKASKGKGGQGRIGNKKRTTGAEEEEIESDDEDEDGEEEGDFGGQDDYDDDLDDPHSTQPTPQHPPQQQKAKPLTNYQRTQALKQQEIRQIETELIAEKSWEMKGEITSNKRPENSLLEVNVDIERASKPTPLITETYTNTLEDMIIKRIKDSMYNDVEPRDITNTNTINELNSNNNDNIYDLSQEKSNIGLGEIYANEYLERMGQVTPAGIMTNNIEDALKKTIKGLFHTICRDLDGLSHFYYTPKPVSIEGNITTTPTVSTILLEDIAPYSIHSQNTSLTNNTTPESVYTKKRGREGALELLSTKELTTDDRKRIRNARKHSIKKTKLQQKHTDIQIAKSDPTSTAFKLLEEKTTTSILEKDKRVTLTSTATHSSTSTTKNKKNTTTNTSTTTNTNTSNKTSFTKSNNFFKDLQLQVAQDVRGFSNNKRGAKSGSGTFGGSTGGGVGGAGKSSSAYKL